MKLRRATKDMASFQRASGRMAEDSKQNNKDNKVFTVIQLTISDILMNIDQTKGRTEWEIIEWQQSNISSDIPVHGYKMQTWVFLNVVAEGYCLGKHTLIIITIIIREQENSWVVLILLPCYVLPGTAATWQTSLTAAISGPGTVK